MAGDWGFKFKSFGSHLLSALASKPSLTIMALFLAPSAVWLTLSRLGQSVGTASNTKNMSPESGSSLFPDRPIRPLPKRRLRERLSPDVADTIKYPPAPQNNAPLFYYPYSLKAETGASNEVSNVVGRENTAELAQETGARRNGLGGGGRSSDYRGEGLVSQASRRGLVSRPPYDSSGHVIRTPPRHNQGRHATPQPPPSTASSADGYDSFENTNNKKKRKIPTAGESMLGVSHVVSDSSILGVPSPPTTGDEGSGDQATAIHTPYYQSVNGLANGQGISGPGRGRYGRHRNGRSPLRTLPEPNTLWAKNPKLKAGGQYPVSPAGESFGIISNAIASAEKLPAPHGQENMSLLQQQTAPKASPASSQFTFTFDSQVPGSVSWPGSDPLPHQVAATSQASTSANQRDPYAGTSTRATQTGQPPLSSVSQGAGAPCEGAMKGPTRQKKPKRRSGNSLLQAAKERRQQTAYQNYHHPPAPEDVWICEFCEYESIFRRPPEALIRMYEIKDRRRRREEAERRRLLEKAKMKSRKGKKASNKAPAKANATSLDRTPAPSEGHPAPPMRDQQSQETLSEDLNDEGGDFPEENMHKKSHAPGDSGHQHATHATVLGHAGGEPGGGGNYCIPVS